VLDEFTVDSDRSRPHRVRRPAHRHVPTASSKSQFAPDGEMFGVERVSKSLTNAPPPPPKPSALFSRSRNLATARRTGRRPVDRVFKASRASSGRSEKEATKLRISSRFSYFPKQFPPGAMFMTPGGLLYHAGPPPRVSTRTPCGCGIPMSAARTRLNFRTLSPRAPALTIQRMNKNTLPRLACRARTSPARGFQVSTPITQGLGSTLRARQHRGRGRGHGKARAGTASATCRDGHQDRPRLPRHFRPNLLGHLPDR